MMSSFLLFCFRLRYYKNRSKNSWKNGGRDLAVLSASGDKKETILVYYSKEKPVNTHRERKYKNL